MSEYNINAKYFQGGAKFPTGSKKNELLQSLRTASRGRIGEIPIPTVKVRMRENVNNTIFADICALSVFFYA